MSFKLKIITLFIFISLTPYLIAISYITYKSQRELLYDMEKELNFDLELVTERIEHEINSIKKDFLFISKLEIMDDIITNDLDKRITHILQIKKRDINLIGDFFVTDLNNKIVASSNMDFISKILNFKTEFNTTIKASFNSKAIGYFYLKYDLINLKKLLKSDSKKSIYLYDESKREYLFKSKIKNPITKIKKLHIFNNLSIYISIDKDLVFNIFTNFKYILFFSIIGGVILIILGSIYLASKITLPIKKLSDTAIDISLTKDYTKRVEISSSDEIGKLAIAFNTMINSTKLALDKLEVESRARLNLFIKLIDIFNRVTMIKDKSECEVIAKEEVNEFLKYESIDITKDEYKKFLTQIDKMINLQIEKLNLIEETKASSRAKSTFIANMSHELRTPLNAIIGFSQVLQLESNEPEIAKNIEISGKHLLDIINEILDMAKVEAGKIEVYKEEIFIDTLLQEIYIITNNLIKEKNLEYILNLNTNLKVYSDKRLLKQILLNIISNSIKFTSSGFISIEVKKVNEKVIFIIKDSGIGIDKKDINKLFNQFVQIENPMQKRYKGTGLGLYLTKQFTNLISADISIKSEGVGKGVEVTIKV